MSKTDDDALLELESASNDRIADDRGDCCMERPGAKRLSARVLRRSCSMSNLIASVEALVASRWYSHSTGNISKGGTQGLAAMGRRVQSHKTYLWLVGNGRMVVIVVITLPHSSIPY